jgi:hypothetical protein
MAAPLEFDPRDLPAELLHSPPQPLTEEDTGARIEWRDPLHTMNVPGDGYCGFHALRIVVYLASGRRAVWSIAHTRDEIVRAAQAQCGKDNAMKAALVQLRKPHYATPEELALVVERLGYNCAALTAYPAGHARRSLRVLASAPGRRWVVLHLVGRDAAGEKGEPVHYHLAVMKRGPRRFDATLSDDELERMIMVLTPAAEVAYVKQMIESQCDAVADITSRAIIRNANRPRERKQGRFTNESMEDIERPAPASAASARALSAAQVAQQLADDEALARRLSDEDSALSAAQVAQQLAEDASYAMALALEELSDESDGDGAESATSSAKPAKAQKKHRRRIVEDDD